MPSAIKTTTGRVKNLCFIKSVFYWLVILWLILFVYLLLSDDSTALILLMRLQGYKKESELANSLGVKNENYAINFFINLLAELTKSIFNLPICLLFILLMYCKAVAAVIFAKIRVKIPEVSLA